MCEERGAGAPRVLRVSIVGFGEARNSGKDKAVDIKPGVNERNEQKSCRVKSKGGSPGAQTNKAVGERTPGEVDERKLCQDQGGIYGHSSRG